MIHFRNQNYLLVSRHYKTFQNHIYIYIVLYSQYAGRVLLHIETVELITDNAELTLLFIRL